MQVIAENFSEEDIKGLKAMFANIDTDQSGTITYEELKTGLARLGSKLTEAEVRQLMEAVSKINSPSKSSKLKFTFWNFIVLLHCHFRLMWMGMGLSTTSSL